VNPALANLLHKELINKHFSVGCPEAATSLDDFDNDYRLRHCQAERELSQGIEFELHELARAVYERIIAKALSDCKRRSVPRITNGMATISADWR
jgi:hypothetical protein